MTQSPQPGEILTSKSSLLLKAGDVLKCPDGRTGFFERGNEDTFRVRSAYGGIWIFYAEDQITFIGRPDQDGWIPHDGRPNPVPGCRVDVRWTGMNAIETYPADVVSWRKGGVMVEAFRLAAPSVERTEGLGSFSPEEAKIPTCDAATFQDRVQAWVIQCFGAEIAGNAEERADRFVEEALELVQSLGYAPDRAHALVDYVFGRPAGDPPQEVGGTMVTLATLCARHGLDMMDAGEVELARILQPEIVEKIRRKQAAKPTGSALPVATTAAEPGTVGMEREARNEPKSASDIAFEAVTEGLCDPEPDVAGARERLAGEVDFWNRRNKTDRTIEVSLADLRLILSAYDRQGEEADLLRCDLSQMKAEADAKVRELREEIERLRARNEKLCPVHSTPYDPKHPDDLQRLVREVGGYLKTCRGSCGSDTKGRDHAIECLEAIAADLIGRARQGGPDHG